MNKALCAQVALAIVCVVSSSVATASDSIFLRCKVTGFMAVDDAEKPVEETVDVEVESYDDRLNIGIAGRDISAAMLSRDVETGEVKMTAKNLSRDHDWYLVNNTKIKDGQGSFQTSVRINRLSGVIAFTQRGVVKKTHRLKIVADGTCVKQDAERKF